MMLASIATSVHGNADLSVVLLLIAAAVFFVAALLFYSTGPKPFPSAWACVALCLLTIGLAVS